jgi:hypothetical protein
MSDADLGKNYEYADGEAYIEARFASGKLNYLAISTSEITWEPTASRRRPAFSSHLISPAIRVVGQFGDDKQRLESMY